MMRRIELARGRRLTPADIARSGGIDVEVLGVAQRIVDDVKARGDEAVFEHTSQLDKVTLSELRVTDAEIEAALAMVGDGFKEAIALAATAIESFHRRQVPQS